MDKMTRKVLIKVTYDVLRNMLGLDRDCKVVGVHESDWNIWNNKDYFFVKVEHDRLPEALEGTQLPEMSVEEVRELTGLEIIGIESVITHCCIYPPRSAPCAGESWQSWSYSEGKPDKFGHLWEPTDPRTCATGLFTCRNCGCQSDESETERECRGSQVPV
jgi:hypothetical protein